MKIIKPYAKMMPMIGTYDSADDKMEHFTLEMGLELLKHVEWCARISHRSEEGVTEDSWQRILKHVVMEHGDWSVTEHASVSVDAYVDRGITHEWVRHRLFSYTQESTRFVNYEKKMPPSFVVPPGMEDLLENEVTQANIHRRINFNSWKSAIQACEHAYKELVENKVAPQLARSVLPNALASRIIITGNLRSWRHFFIMRTTQETHPQMKEVSIPLLAEFKEKIPLLYDDIEPNLKQSESMKRMR